MTKKTKDTTKCKEWERQRRDRLNLAFDGLAQLLPFYDPAKPMTKIDILEKSTQFIKEIRLTNSRLLVDKCQPQETSKKVHQLQEEVNKLIIRVRQLTLLLKQANIAIPLGPSIRLLGKKRRKWSAKLISQEIENADPTDVAISSKKLKRKPTVASSKRKPIHDKNDASNKGLESRILDVDGAPVASSTEKGNASHEKNETIAVESISSVPVSDVGLPKSSDSVKQTGNVNKIVSAVSSSSIATTSSTSTATAKLIGPLTQSNVQNVQPVISAGMPLTINLSSTLTPVTFSGQLGFSNLSLQQIRPTIILSSPITCTLPQSSTISPTMLGQFGSNASTKTSDSNLNILPKYIIPSCSLQKIPIKCIRKPFPRKKYKPRGNSKKRLELLAMKASQAQAAKEAESKTTALESVSQGQVEKSVADDEPPRSPSPELIDISKDAEVPREKQPTSTAETDESNQKELGAFEKSLESPQDEKMECSTSVPEVASSKDATFDLIKEPSTSIQTSVEVEGEAKDMNIQEDTLCTDDKVQPPNKTTSIKDGEITDTRVDNDNEINKNTFDKADQPTEPPCPSIPGPTTGQVQRAEEDEPVPKNSEPEKQQPGDALPRLEKPAPAPSMDSRPILTSHGTKDIVTAPSISDGQELAANKPPTKTLTAPIAATQNSSDLRRLLEEEEEVSLSSEDKISECIARSIGLIDDHPACSDLMELSTDWSAVVNSHLTSKSPISPTQMFLSMFPLLPREGLIGDNIFSQKTPAGLLGCGRSSFSMNPASHVLLEDSATSGTATPTSITTMESLAMHGAETSSYSWAQPPLGEASYVQSKFNSIFSSHRPNKRSVVESKSQDEASTSKYARPEKQIQCETLSAGTSHSFTSLQPMPATVVSRHMDSSANSKQIISDQSELRTQTKVVQGKKSRKSLSSKANTKIPDSVSRSSNVASKTKRIPEASKQAEGRNARLPLQSPPASLPSPRSFITTSPKGKEPDTDSHFMPFRSTIHSRTISGSGSDMSRRQFETSSNSPTKSATFLPTLSNPVIPPHTNLPFELFRPAVSNISSSTPSGSSHFMNNVTSPKDKSSGHYQILVPSATNRKDSSSDAHRNSNQFVAQPTPQPVLQLGSIDATPQYNTCTYDDSRGRGSASITQSSSRFTHVHENTPGNSSTYTALQCNRSQSFQPCEPSGRIASSYNLDTNAAKSKVPKLSQHFPFYLPEPSYQKRSEAFPSGSYQANSDCLPAGNYTYHQHGGSSLNLNHLQVGDSQNQQQSFFGQPQPQPQTEQDRPSIRQPVVVPVSSSARRPSSICNQNYNSSSSTIPQTSTGKSGHSHSICTSSNYFDQPTPVSLAQYPSAAVHQQQLRDNSRILPDPQHCSETDNSVGGTGSRFAPPFINQRHPTVNWMTDPSGPSPNSPSLDYGNMLSTSGSKKTNRNSNHGSHNPFSVSTLMGSNQNAPTGNNNYDSEAIIRKTATSSWNSFSGNRSATTVSKPEVSPTVSNPQTTQSTSSTNYNSSIHGGPHHHYLVHSSHAHAAAAAAAQFVPPSQFNYFENASLNMDQSPHPNYLSTPVPVPATATTSSTPQLFLQQQQPTTPVQHAGTHHQHQQHHHHCHPHQSPHTHTHPSSSSSVTNFNLSTIFPEINDKRLASSSSSYNPTGGAGPNHGGSQSQPHSHHQISNSGNANHLQSQSQSQQQQQQQSNANSNQNQLNNFSYFVNNLTPK